MWAVTFKYHTYTHTHAQNTQNRCFTTVCWTMRKTAASLFRQTLTTGSAPSPLPRRRGCEKEESRFLRSAKPGYDDEAAGQWKRFVLHAYRAFKAFLRKRRHTNVSKAPTVEKPKGKLHVVESGLLVLIHHAVIAGPHFAHCGFDNDAADL